jgi:hypothetical protein
MIMETALRVISLGAGVQSTTLALMAAQGEIGPMPDYAIFADTGWEPAAVYRHLDWLESVLPFPVHRAKRPGDDLGQLAMRIAVEDITKSAMLPYFTANPDGMLPRQCSKEFKSRVVGRAIKALLGDKHKRGVKSVEQWLGISLEEMQRMKDAEQAFIQNRFPLIEVRMNRNDCLAWMAKNGYPKPPKSACIFCPYHNQEEWRLILGGEDRERLIEFDKAIRPGFVGMKGSAYLSKHRQPIGEADFSTSADAGQIEFGFLQECEGMCGV